MMAITKNRRRQTRVNLLVLLIGFVIVLGNLWGGPIPSIRPSFYKIFFQDTVLSEEMSGTGNQSMKLLNPENMKSHPIVGAQVDPPTLLKTYDFRRTFHILSNESNSHTSNSKKLRTLIFLTTHMSHQQTIFLRYCWPEALRRSKLLNSSDVLVYFNRDKFTSQHKEDVRVLNAAFHRQNLTVHLFQNSIAKDGDDRPVKQRGAMDALTAAVQHRWFDDYDWIIRLNPDVIIRNDTWMMDIISNEESAVSALLINCYGETKSEASPKVHTDFFVLRPKELSLDSFQVLTSENAEFAFTNEIAHVWEDEEKVRWIPGASPLTTACRAGNGRPMNESDVIHYHMVRFDGKKCSIPFDG